MNSVKAQERWRRRRRGGGGMSWKEGREWRPCCPVLLLAAHFLQTPVPPVLLLWATKLQRSWETSSLATALLSLPPSSPSSLCLSLSFSSLALRQAPVHQSGDPGRERRAREEPTGAGTNSERAHQRAQVQVSRTSIQRSQQNQQICSDGSANTAHTQIRYTLIRWYFTFYMLNESANKHKLKTSTSDIFYSILSPDFSLNKLH